MIGHGFEPILLEQRDGKLQKVKDLERQVSRMSDVLAEQAVENAILRQRVAKLKLKLKRQRNKARKR